MFRGKVGAALVTAIGLLSAGCSDNGVTSPDLRDPSGSASLALSVVVPTAGGDQGSQGAIGPVFDLMLGDGANELVIDYAAVVLREVELKRDDASGCDDSSNGFDDDDCEEIEFGPMLLELPLDGAVEQVLTVDGVPAGVYDELEFKIHKPDDDTAEDRAFLEQFPQFRRVSIWVEGTFNGSPFVYLTDLNEEQEIDLIPPLVLTDALSAANVTLSLDMGSWFRAADGTLIDPATANEDGVNEELVEANIEASIEGFEDDDRDGFDDDEDEDDEDEDEDEDEDDDDNGGSSSSS
jgi:hypothetical protein